MHVGARCIRLLRCVSFNDIETAFAPNTIWALQCPPTYLSLAKVVIRHK